MNQLTDPAFAVAVGLAIGFAILCIILVTRLSSRKGQIERGANLLAQARKDRDHHAADLRKVRGDLRSLKGSTSAHEVEALRGELAGAQRGLHILADYIRGNDRNTRGITSQVRRGKNGRHRWSAYSAAKPKPAYRCGSASRSFKREDEAQSDFNELFPSLENAPKAVRTLVDRFREPPAD